MKTVIIFLIPLVLIVGCQNSETDIAAPEETLHLEDEWDMSLLAGDPLANPQEQLSFGETTLEIE